MEIRSRLRSRNIILILGLSITVAFSVLALRGVNWRDVADALTGARIFPWVPLAAASYIVANTVRGLRLRLLVSNDSDLSPIAASNIVAVGYAVNNLLPGRIGELARAYMLSKKTGIRFTQALTVTILERILDGLAMLFLFAVAVIYVSSQAIESQLISTTLIVSVVLAFLSAALFIAIAVASPHNFARMVGNALGLVRHAWHEKGLTIGLHIASGVAYLRQPAGAAKIALLSLGTWLSEACMFFFTMAAFDMPLIFGRALLSMTITNFGVVLPSSPGFVGPWHYFCTESVKIFGVETSVALSYAIVVHLTFYVTITLWGVLVLALFGVEWRQLASLREAGRTVKSAELSERQYVNLLSLPRAPIHKDIQAETRFYKALSETIMPVDELDLDEESRERCAESVVEFVKAELSALPGRLRLMFIIGMLGFRVATRLRYFRSFCALPRDKRAEWVTLWADGPIGLTRKLFRPLRSFILLSFYEIPEVLRALDAAASTPPVAGEGS